MVDISQKYFSIISQQKAAYPLYLFFSSPINDWASPACRLLQYWQWKQRRAQLGWRRVYWASYWWLSFYQNILTSQRSRKLTLSFRENIKYIDIECASHPLEVKAGKPLWLEKTETRIVCLAWSKFGQSLLTCRYDVYSTVQYLLVWCVQCRAPAAPPGCWWPSRGWCRSPARGTGSRSAGTYFLSGCIESPADISIMICLFIFYGQAIKRLCWGKLDCLSGLTWMFASSEVLLKVQRNLRLFPDMIRSDKFHDQD